MKLVGVTAALSADDNGLGTIHASIIAGPDKRNVSVVKQAKFTSSTAFMLNQERDPVRDFVGEAISLNEPNPDVRTHILIGREISQKRETEYLDICVRDWFRSEFKDDASVYSGGFFGRQGKYQKAAPLTNGYSHYMDRLFAEADMGDSGAQESLRTEARHTGLRIAMGVIGTNDKMRSGDFWFLKVQENDPLLQAIFRSEELRRICANEIRKIIGLSGNFCLKSEFHDPHSPYFSDVLLVSLANEADKITGEEGDSVLLKQS